MALAAAVVVAGAITGFRDRVVRTVLAAAVLAAAFWWRFDELRGKADWAIRVYAVGLVPHEPGFGAAVADRASAPVGAS